MAYVAALSGGPWVLLLAAVGLPAVFALSRVLPRVTGRPGPGPSLSRGRGVIVLVVLGATATTLAVLGVMWLGIYFWIRSASDFERVARAARLGQDPTSSTAALLRAVILLVIAGLIWRSARALTAPTVHALRRRDHRPPILFLRGFVDDNIRIYARRSRRHSWLARLSLRRNERFEEILAWSLGTYGPVIAISEPHRRRRRSGAARESLPTEDWLAVVRKRIHESALTVFVVGDTPGLLLEARTIANDACVEQALFVMPPLDNRAVAYRWKVMAEVVGIAAELLDHGAGIVAVRVADGQPIFYRGKRRDDMSYEAAIEAAIIDLREHQLLRPEGPESVRSKVGAVGRTARR
jgi:hypothetical protein